MPNRNHGHLEALIFFCQLRYHPRHNGGSSLSGDQESSFFESCYVECSLIGDTEHWTWPHFYPIVGHVIAAKCKRLEEVSRSWTRHFSSCVFPHKIRHQAQVTVAFGVVNEDSSSLRVKFEGYGQPDGRATCQLRGM